jgi:hypothetical protein
MTGLMHRCLDAPKETRPFEDNKGHVDLVGMEHGGVGRGVFEPGWQWFKHVKPIAQTDSCMAPHAGCCLSGHMHIVMNDGEAAAGRDHERLRTHHVGEIRTNPLATAPGVEEVDEIPAPRPAPPDELEILTGQRMERMRHPHTSPLTRGNQCTRRVEPTP